VEVGAGLGSLTVALAATGARVVAVEFDRSLEPALREVVGGLSNVEMMSADALAMPWASVAVGGSWSLVANLPYNIATPLLLSLLQDVPAIRRFLVMVQREAGERLAAHAGEAGYGAVSLKIAYRAEASVIRRVPPTVFWPRPKVDSVLVRLSRRSDPPVDVDAHRLFSVVDVGFAERRKMMSNGLRRLGLSRADAAAALAACRIDARARPEDIDLAGFACLAGVPAVARAVDERTGHSS
jgi:16S rRNA (adenine1518-N6/adenine1519-N6)-dimethyltransferase